MKRYNSLFKETSITHPSGRHFDTKVDYNNREIKVRVFPTGYMSGSAGSFHEPASGAEVDFEVYLLHGNSTGPEVSDKLSPEELNIIAQKVEEFHNDDDTRYAYEEQTLKEAKPEDLVAGSIRNLLQYKDPWILANIIKKVATPEQVKDLKRAL